MESVEPAFPCLTLHIVPGLGNYSEHVHTKKLATKIKELPIARFLKAYFSPTSVERVS
jgi:hypothetical protein